jgi:RimJ/RimL family protein N-acetyltransferase
VAPPGRLELGGTVLRRFTVDDAAPMAAAVGESLEHLARWLPWADATTASPDAQLPRMRDSLAAYDDPHGTWHYAICDDRGRLIGSASIVVRDDGRTEIGYWVHVDHVGRGHALRAAQLLTDMWRAHRDEPRIEIRCDEGNVASASIPRKLGYTLERVVDGPCETPYESGRTQVWVTAR